MIQVSKRLRCTYLCDCTPPPPALQWPRGDPGPGFQESPKFREMQSSMKIKRTHKQKFRGIKSGPPQPSFVWDSVKTDSGPFRSQAHVLRAGQQRLMRVCRSMGPPPPFRSLPGTPMTPPRAPAPAVANAPCPWQSARGALRPGAPVPVPRGPRRAVVSGGSGVCPGGWGGGFAVPIAVRRAPAAPPAGHRTCARAKCGGRWRRALPVHKGRPPAPRGTAPRGSDRNGGAHGLWAFRLPLRPVLGSVTDRPHTSPGGGGGG